MNLRSDLMRDKWGQDDRIFVTTLDNDKKYVIIKSNF